MHRGAINLQNQKKMNHLMYRNDIKLFAKNEKELETLITIYCQDIGIEFGTEKGATLIIKMKKDR